MNDDIFMLFAKMPDALPLYEAVEGYMTTAFPDVKSKVGKTQVSFSGRYGFAFVSLPAGRIKNRPPVCITLSFGLGYHLEHPRILHAVEPYPGRWTHHMLISKPEEMDEQVKGWLQEAWNFSLHK